MDMPDHAELGCDCGADGAGQNAGAVLLRAIWAGAGGGGLFSGGDRLSDALVSDSRSRPGAGALLCRHAGRADYQPENFKPAAQNRHARPSRAAGHARVAVALHFLGSACDRAGDSGARDVARSSARRGMAQCGREIGAGGRIARRSNAPPGRPARDCACGAVSSKSIAADGGVFLHHQRELWL